MASTVQTGNKPNGRRGALKDLTKERLKELYDKHTDSQIAEMYGVSGVAISYFRKKYKIPTITLRQRKARERGGPTLEDLTPARLIELYSQMGDREIAKIYGVSKPTIRNLRKKWSVSPISKTERSTDTREMTAEQKEVCIGTLLGDGHLLESGVLKVGHAYHQLSYLQQLHRILSPYSRPISYSERVVVTGNLTFAFSFRTVQHTWLKSLRKLFYPQGRRIFPESILQDLTPRSLAYWYFDDGNLGEGLPSFALGDVTDAEASKVVRLVGERFSLDTYLPPSPSPTCRLMGIRARSTDAFFFLIRDFASPDMLYKLPTKHWPKEATPKTFAKSTPAIRLPKELRDRCSAWKNLDSSDQEVLLHDVVSFWESEGFPYSEARPEELQILSALEESQVIQEGALKLHSVGQASCHAFSSHIWEAKSYGAPYSPADIFSDPGLLSQALKFSLSQDQIPTAGRVRGALRLWRRTGVYNFRPSASKVLVDRYCPQGGTVWDPCAGYGGRLMGALLSGARPSYIACEPNTKSYEALLKLHQWMVSYLPELRGKVDLNCVPAEEYTPPQQVDLVLTSPPYWKREVYSDEETQSGVRYSTYQSWLEGFWKPVIEKAVKAVKVGGWLVLNVDDFVLGGVEYKLVKDTTEAMSNLGFGPPEYIKYTLPGGGNIQDNSEAILCWSKGASNSGALNSSKVVDLSACRSCQAIRPVSSLQGGVCGVCLSPKGTPRECEGCRKTFRAERKDQRFHSVNCYARYRRRKKRERNPVKETRTFTCRDCGSTWETKEKGNFWWCPTCRETRDKVPRTKTCQYRHCGETFLDGSPKNSAKYCCPEHRRREKLFRAGIAQDENYFKQPSTGLKQCLQCKDPFKPKPGERKNRCPKCLESNRHKTCRKCGEPYRDDSLNNTRRLCFECGVP